MPDNQLIRFISIGRLLHWKGFHLGLRAFHQANLPKAEYWIVGEGSELKRLQKLAHDLKISNQVKFWGWLSRPKTLSILENCHLLVHPSLHDSGGMVCMEAMAAGRPVICLDLGGPAIQVTEKTGFKIKVETPQQAVQDIAAVMVRLSKDRAMIRHMGQAAKQRISQNYDWKYIGKSLNQIYSDASLN